MDEAGSAPSCAMMLWLMTEPKTIMINLINFMRSTVRTLIGNFIDSSSYIVGYIQRSIRTLCKTAGSVFRLTGRLNLFHARKIVGEKFPIHPRAFRSQMERRRRNILFAFRALLCLAIFIQVLQVYDSVSVPQLCKLI